MPKTKNRSIVLVDDDQPNAQHDLDALFSKGFDVEYFSSVSDCDAKLRTLLRKTDMFIIDVIFKDEKPPHPCSFYPNNAAGLWLAVRIRKLKPDMPIILYSFDRSELIYPAAKATAADLTVAERRNCVFLKKQEYLSSRLAKVVHDYFERGVFEVSPLERASRLLDDALNIAEKLKLLPWRGKRAQHD